MHPSIAMFHLLYLPKWYLGSTLLSLSMRYSHKILQCPDSGTRSTLYDHIYDYMYCPYCFASRERLVQVSRDEAETLLLDGKTGAYLITQGVTADLFISIWWESILYNHICQLLLLFYFSKILYLLIILNKFDKRANSIYLFQLWSICIPSRNFQKITRIASGRRAVRFDWRNGRILQKSSDWKYFAIARSEFLARCANLIIPLINECCYLLILL